MNPVAFELFGVSIRWYGIIIAGAMIIGVYLAAYRGKKMGFAEDIVVDLALWVLPAAVVGARLYYVVFEFDNYRGDVWRMINFREGGMAIHGGILGGLLAGYIYTRLKKINFWELADLLMPSLILGQAIGRWGNFINQEAHGGPTNLPWGIVIDGQKVHPTFLYESLWNLIVFFVLLAVAKRRRFQGEVVCYYFVLYSVGRFFIEGLRTDSLMLGPLRVAQLISLLLIVIGLTLLIYKRLKSSGTT